MMIIIITIAVKLNSYVKFLKVK